MNNLSTDEVYDDTILAEYGSSIRSKIIRVMISLPILLLGIMYLWVDIIFSVLLIFIGLGVMVSPFRYKIAVTNDSIYINGLFRIKHIDIEDVTGIVDVKYRNSRNLGPIAIKKAIVIRTDNSKFSIPLGRLGLSDAEELLTFLQ